MSFSGEVREELANQLSEARHCQIAEIAAIVNMQGKVLISETGDYSVRIHTENESVARKCFTLLVKAFNIEAEITIRENIYLKKKNVYLVIINNHQEALLLLQATKLLDANNQIDEAIFLVSNVVIQRTCCKRAFLRGAFLVAGSISAPEKFYHLEIVCTRQEKAEKLQEIIGSLGLEAKVVSRKKYFVVYIKEGSGIVDMLGLMGANIALMNLENVRILKEMRNNVNRKVNCETANINKTVSASVKQMEDIRYIEETVGLLDLTDRLQEVATLRLKYPGATLKELGEMLDPVVGKSGVNHRLRKLSEIAKDIRGSKEEELL